MQAALVEFLAQILTCVAAMEAVPVMSALSPEMEEMEDWEANGG